MSDNALAQFARPGRFEFSVNSDGFTFINLTNRTGWQAQISLYGGQVLSWRAPNQSDELLFLSSKAEFCSGKAIRGGIPVVFPQFGSGALPSHGFARTSLWQVQSVAEEKDGELRCELVLNATPQTLELWPHHFSLLLVVRLSSSLSLELVTTNTDSTPLTFQSLLHTYFRVPNISQVRIEGLAGVEYINFLDDRKRCREQQGRLSINQFTDQVYLQAPDRIKLHNGRGATIIIDKSDFSELVCWNPWVEKTKNFKDLLPESYKEFLCLEPGNIEQPLVLAPGASHSSRLVLSVI